MGTRWAPWFWQLIIFLANSSRGAAIAFPAPFNILLISRIRARTSSHRMPKPTHNERARKVNSALRPGGERAQDLVQIHGGKAFAY
jgi:hypothetical protein